MGRLRGSKQRILAVLLCLALLAMLMFCTTMAAKQVLHSCCNSSCPVCEVLQSSQYVLKLLVFSACVAAVLATAPNFMRAGRRPVLCGVYCSNSLVNLKIRINH